MAASAPAAPWPETRGPAAGPTATPVTVLKVNRIGEGTITSSPTGINCGPRATDCQANFTTGSTVTLSTAPEQGWAFHVWDPNGPCRNVQTSTCSFQLTGTFLEVTGLFVGINFSRVSVSARWKQSVLTGTLNLAGAASHATQLRLLLVSTARRAYTLSATLPAGGAFTRPVRLPRTGFFPGSYAIQIDAVVTGRPIPPQNFQVNVPAPREGVVARAFVSSQRSATPVTRLPPGTTGIRAHFIFATQPTSRGISATWFLGGRRIGTIQYQRSNRIVVPVNARTGLPSGRYRCVLRAGSRVVKVVSVRIG